MSFLIKVASSVVFVALLFIAGLLHFDKHIKETEPLATATQLNTVSDIIRYKYNINWNKYGLFKETKQAKNHVNTLADFLAQNEQINTLHALQTQITQTAIERLDSDYHNNANIMRLLLVPSKQTLSLTPMPVEFANTDTSTSHLTKNPTSTWLLHLPTHVHHAFLKSPATDQAVFLQSLFGETLTQGIPYAPNDIPEHTSTLASLIKQNKTITPNNTAITCLTHIKSNQRHTCYINKHNNQFGIYKYLTIMPQWDYLSQQRFEPIADNQHWLNNHAIAIDIGFKAILSHSLNQEMPEIKPFEDEHAILGDGKDAWITLDKKWNQLLGQLITDVMDERLTEKQYLFDFGKDNQNTPFNKWTGNHNPNKNHINQMMHNLCIYNHQYTLLHLYHNGLHEMWRKERYEYDAFVSRRQRLLDEKVISDKVEFNYCDYMATVQLLNGQSKRNLGALRAQELGIDNLMRFVLIRQVVHNEKLTYRTHTITFGLKDNQGLALVHID